MQEDTVAELRVRLGLTEVAQRQLHLTSVLDARKGNGDVHLSSGAGDDALCGVCELDTVVACESGSYQPDLAVEFKLAGDLRCGARLAQLGDLDTGEGVGLHAGEVHREISANGTQHTSLGAVADLDTSVVEGAIACEEDA